MVSVKSALGGIIIAVFLAFLVGFFVFYPKAKAAVSAVETQLPDLSCPEKAKMDDYANRMRVFAATDSPSPDPKFAIDVFWEYLSCRSPKMGSARFKTADVNKHEPEILACAKAAYINHLEVLKKKKMAAGGNKEDIKYYDAEIKKYNTDYEVFKIIFPESSSSQTLCNYQATGRS